MTTTTFTTMSLLLVGLLLSAQTISVVASECIDNPNYTTRLGLTCAQHNEWKCEGFASAGFTPDEVDELLTNCPVSCGTCEGAAGQRRRRQQQQVIRRKEQMRQTVMDELEGRVDIVDVRRKAGNNNIAQQQQQTQQREVQELEACHPGWLPFCQDDPTYNSQIDLPCWAHAVIDCTALVDIGFTELEVMDLVEHCPCSCNVECGTFTLSPTLSPTDAPTITKKPTESPTLRPTPQPTPAPTPRPSLAPITPFPSLSPTPAPSAEPTSAPTGTPTISPTARPSATPTSAPTATASASPSAAPTAVPTTPILVTPRMEKPQRPQQDDEHNSFSIFIIAGIAVGGVAFAVLAAILFFKMGRGPRTPSTTMPPKSKKKTKAMHKLILAELQQNPTATSRSEGGGSSEDSDADDGDHDSVEDWMENPTLSSFNFGPETPKAVETAQQKLERQLHTYNVRPHQILRDDISMATKDIGNVEVELTAHEASQRSQQRPGTKFRNFIGRALSPRSNKSWYDEEYGQPQADEGASEDDTSFDPSEAVQEAMVASGLSSAFSGETPRAGNHVGPLLMPSHSGSAGSASRGATIFSHNTRRKEDLVYKGANKAGKSPEVEVVCAHDVETGCAISAQEEETPAKVGFFSRLFRKKEPKQQEPAAPVPDIDLEDCNTLSRFTVEGHTFDGPADTNPSGILRGMGSDTAETVKGGVSFGPKTKFGSGASMSSGSTHPSKTSGKSIGSENSGFFWNAVDESGACIEHTATCGKSELLRRESSGALPMQDSAPMNAPSRLSAIPTLNTTKDDATMEAGEVERELSRSSNSRSSSSKSDSGSRRGVDMPMTSKGSLASSSTDIKTPRASHSSSSKSKIRSTKMAAPVPVTRSASASTVSAKSGSQAVGRIRSLPKGARPKANRLIAQATSYDDESINEKDLGIAMVQAPMRMQASIATEEEEDSVASSHPHSEPTAKNHNRRETSQSSRHGDQKVVRSASTRSLSTKDEKGKVESQWDGTYEPIAHDPPVANVKPFAFARVESGITTPTTIQPSRSALKHIDSSPSYESTYDGKPRTSEKYKNDHREEEDFVRHHRSSSRHRSGSRHRHHREHREDRPPRSSSRRREHSRERHNGDRRHNRDYDDDRRRSRDRHDHEDDRLRSRSHSRRREEHSERRHRSRSQSHRHHHDDYTHEDRRRSRSRDERRHRESSRHRHHSSRRHADEQSEEGALFRPKIPFMPSESTGSSNSYHR